MKKLSARGQRWLMAIHLYFACIWVGAASALILLGAFFTTDSDGALYGADLAKRMIDDYMVVPAAMGCLFTGLAYSIFTRWGFFRYWWVAFKWLVTLAGIIFGTFWLGPWLNSLSPISKELGLRALADPAYTEAARLNLTWGTAQVATLVTAVLISVFKPWGKTKAE